MTKTLDLHKIKHDDAERLVENFVLLNENPLTIITGNSDNMKKIVVDKLKQLNIKYEQWANKGEYKIL